MDVKNNGGFKTRKQIAAELNISTKTLGRYTEIFKIKFPKSRMLTPKEYAPLYEILGH